ncbi:hypothetical protein MMC29_005915 [Sticta canariensis]|nr:hypothetical protein [Sticta canariensis]
MHFSIPSLLGPFCLSLLASTGLATSYSASTDNTEAIVEINQLLSNYSHILDDKKYSDLSYILTEDAVFHLPNFNYSTRAIAEQRFSAEYLNKTTLHTSVNVVVYDISTTTATVLTDSALTYFGQENLTGQFFTDYSRIKYAVIKENGSWRISETTITAGPYVGNPAISS